MLGYIRMMQGRFAEDEESFKSYRFIAPDQANPHDSLGELYITTGRYDEAEKILGLGSRLTPDSTRSTEEARPQSSRFSLQERGAEETRNIPDIQTTSRCGRRPTRAIEGGC